jgi:glutamate racemase
MTKKLGVYDSGLGGFSLVKEILKDPFLDEIFYYSDYERLPYGNLSIKELEHRGLEICQYLLNQNVDAILLACNTATVNTINFLRQQFQVPFVGVEPYINAIQKEESLSDKQNIGLIVTPATAKSERVSWLKENFDQDDRVTIVASENLARSIEQYIRGSRKSEAELANIVNELNKLNEMGFEGLILGCTHYPLIQDVFEKSLEIPVVDPGSYVVQHLRGVLDLSSDDTKSSSPKISFSENLHSEWQILNQNQIDIML